MNEQNLSDYDLHDVSNFEIISDYTLRIWFDDDTEQVVNFEPILYGPLFGPLRDLTLFNQVELDQEIGTLVWPNGADIDPTVLHDWPTHRETIIQRRQKQFAASPT